MAVMDLNEALGRKRQQNHKTDYEWQVILPNLDDNLNPNSVANKPIYINEFNLAGGIRELSSAAGRLFQGVANFINEDREGYGISDRVYRIDTPYDVYETKKNLSGATFWYSATHSDIGNITMAIDEMDDCGTMKYIKAWMSLLSNPDGTHNPPAIYKRNILFYQLNRSGDEIFKSTYVNYFPTEITPVSWSYDGNSVLQYNVSFTGDSVKHEKL